MMLLLKKAAELTDADLRAYPVWAAYYEPDEFELLEEVGIDSHQARQILTENNFSDAYVFPLPASAASLPFKYLHLSAEIRIPDGRVLCGFRTDACLCVIFKGKHYYFNQRLPSLSQDHAGELCSALGILEVFPLNVYIEATSENEEFDLPDKEWADNSQQQTLSNTRESLARIEVPPGFVRKIGPEMKMDCHWIDVRLKSGMVFTNLVVRGGRYITGHAKAPNGESELSFTADEIRNVRRHVPLLANWWPFW